MKLRDLYVVTKHNATPGRVLKIGDRFAHINYTPKITVDKYQWEVTAYRHHKYNSLAVKQVDSTRDDFYHTPYDPLVAKEK